MAHGSPDRVKNNYLMSALRRQKKPALTDWHKADIKAALEKAGWSLRRLGQHHGYAGTTLKAALTRPWPKAEQLIAEAIGVDPAEIWPTRYRRKSSTGPANKKEAA